MPTYKHTFRGLLGDVAKSLGFKDQDAMFTAVVAAARSDAGVRGALRATLPELFAEAPPGAAPEPVVTGTGEGPRGPSPGRAHGVPRGTNKDVDVPISADSRVTLSAQVTGPDVVSLWAPAPAKLGVRRGAGSALSDGVAGSLKYVEGSWLKAGATDVVVVKLGAHSAQILVTKVDEEGATLERLSD